MIYREDKKYTEQNKATYRDGLVEVMRQRLRDAKPVRSEYFKDVMSNQEKYRKDLKEMLGWPLVGYTGDKNVTASFEKLSEEEGFTLYRAEFEILEGV